MKNEIEKLMPGPETDIMISELIQSTSLNAEAVPAYSSTWEGMGKLTLILEQEGFQFSIQRTEENYEGHVYDGHDVNFIYAVQYADSAPFALTLAAIVALSRNQ